MGNGSAIYCVSCNYNNASTFRVNRVQTILIQNIFRDTRDPAKTFQAQHTMLTQLAYYDRLFEYDDEVPVILTSFIVKQFPLRKDEFWVVMGVLMINISLVGWIMRMFWRRTNASVVGNAWMAVAQVYGNETERLLAESTRMSDTDVEKEIVMKGRGVVICGLDCNAEGRVEMVQLQD